MTDNLSLGVQGITAAVTSINSLAGALEKMAVSSVRSKMTAMGTSPAPISAGVAEMQAFFGWVTLGIGALGVAAVGAAKLINTAVRDLSDFATNRASLGATGGETGFLHALGGALGMDAMGAAISFRARVNSGGLATATAGRYGIGPSPIDFGPNAVNEAEQFIKFLKGVALTYQSNPGQAENDLRTMGLRGFSGIVQNPAYIDELDRMGQSLAKMVTPEKVMAAMRFNLEMEKLKLSFEQLVLKVGPPLIKWLTSIAEYFDRWIASHPWLAGKLGLSGPDGSHTAAMNKQTQATIDNTNELRALNGTYGGGSRTRTAMPKAYVGTGYMVDDAHMRTARQWGAWSVSL